MPLQRVFLIVRDMRRLFLATLLLSMGCGSESPDLPTVPSIDPAFLGTWQLRTVNGQPLPCSIDASTKLGSGYFKTESAGTFVTQLDKVKTAPGVITIQLDADGGWFTVQGDSLAFHFRQTGETAYGRLSADTLTVREGSLLLALTR